MTGYPKLWILFLHRVARTDGWALCLETELASECETWQLTGQAFEFDLLCTRGKRPEAVPNFKEKLALKEDLTHSNVARIRDIVRHYPMDNEAEFWDDKVFCFEILKLMEVENILNREDETYQDVRWVMHRKWNSDAGASLSESDGDAEPACGI